MSDLFDVRKEIILITGASQGLGRQFARVLAAQGRVSAYGLTQSVGFAGVDGWFALLPDGQVRRGLAVFRVDRSRPAKIKAASCAPS